MATTYYYAYINSSNIVEQIVDLPAPITVPNYISIQSHDVSLIGKRYNAQTGQFEVVTWFCYAMLNEKDIVTQVIRRETALPDVPSSVIVIQTYDESLVGKWYNRANGTFSEPPIHVLAEHSTDKINVGTQDLWLTDKLGSMDSKVSTIDAKVATMDSKLGTVDGKVSTIDGKVATMDGKLGTVEGKVSTIDGKVTTMDGKLGTVDGKFTTIDGKLSRINGLLDRSVKCRISEKKENTIFETAKMIKHYSYQFENPVAGYLPKYVFLQVTWDGEPYDDEDTVNIWLVRNGANTDLYSICRQGELVYDETSHPAVFHGQTSFLFYENANSKDNCFSMNMCQNTVNTKGGDAFVSHFKGLNLTQMADIGNFKYTENGVEFDIRAYYTTGQLLTTRFKLRALAY